MESSKILSRSVQSSAILAISDLHIGSLRFDFWAFQSCVKQLRGYVERNGVRVVALVLLGDNVENTELFREQVFSALRCSFQVEIAAEIIANLASQFAITKVYILRGEHDLRRGVNHAEGLADKLKSRVKGVAYSGETIVLDLHGKRVGFSHSVKNECWPEPPDVCVYGDMHRYTASTGSIFVPGFQVGRGSERGFILFVEDDGIIQHILFSAKPCLDTDQIEIKTWLYYSDILKKLHPPKLSQPIHLMDEEADHCVTLPILSIHHNSSEKNRRQDSYPNRETRVLEDGNGGYIVRNNDRSYGRISRDELEIIKSCRSNKEIKELLGCGRCRASVIMRILRTLKMERDVSWQI